MSNLAATKLWAQRFRRYDAANTTVAAFCKAEGVSEPPYYLLATEVAGGGNPWPAAHKQCARHISARSAYRPSRAARQRGSGIDHHRAA